jgi:hypothetical protein
MTEGRTALVWAATSQYKDVAKLLLQSGADPAIKSKWGHTALDMATDGELRGVAVGTKVKSVTPCCPESHQYCPDHREPSNVHHQTGLH